MKIFGKLCGSTPCAGGGRADNVASVREMALVETRLSKREQLRACMLLFGSFADTNLSTVRTLAPTKMNRDIFKPNYN